MRDRFRNLILQESIQKNVGQGGYALEFDRKHIVFISFNDSLPPRHQLFLDFFKKAGWKTSLIIWDRRDSVDNTSFSFGHHVNKIVIHMPAPTWDKKIIMKLPLLYKQIRRNIQLMDDPIHVVIVTHYFLLPFLFMYPFGKAIILYDAAEMYAIDLSYYFPRFRNSAQKVFSFIETFLVKRVNGILTVDSKGGFLEKHYKESHRSVQVIWNVPSRQMDPEPVKIAALEPHYLGRKVIAFVGGLMREKGLRIALEAVALVKRKYPESLFLFIGPMKDDRKEIRNIVKNKGIESNVRFLEPMSYGEMLAHIRHAQIGLALHQQSRIYPYVSAGNGRKFFTYMQAGVAIIGPRFGEVGKIVKIADCGLLVDTERTVAVAEAIDYLFSHPEERQRMADNGQRAFLERFNWEIEEKKLQSFLNQVMSNKRGTI
jgi:glycosyltransferase involved in cell wall biosynthesis